MRVAVVTNRDFGGVINRFGQRCPQPSEPSPQDSTAGVVAATLQEDGHEVLLCEGDKGLLERLERFMAPDSQGRPSGIVFNLAEGIQGEFRYTHVPAMLEMAGVPYTGSNPFGHGLAQDKVISKRLLRDYGVPTPNFCVMRRGNEGAGDLRFPLIVKPRFEDNSYGLQLVHEHAGLKRAVEIIDEQYGQDALIEEYIDGREVSVPLLGNEELEVLPIVEQDFSDCSTRLMTWEVKYVDAAKVSKICPAPVGSRLSTVLRDMSITTFRACQCRDYARVDFRIDGSGRPFVLEINPGPSLTMDSSYFMAAKTAGYNLSSLINRILSLAHIRCFGTVSLEGRK